MTITVDWAAGHVTNSSIEFSRITDKAAAVSIESPLHMRVESPPLTQYHADRQTTTKL